LPLSFCLWLTHAGIMPWIASEVWETSSKMADKGRLLFVPLCHQYN
jgi:hypothetical protein